MKLADVSIRRPVFAVMLVGSLVVLGLVSIPRLGLDLFPRVEFPIVTVSTVLEGASPETMEREVSQVLEESINTIEGVRTLSSQSSEALSLVFVEFELEYDIQEKAQAVRDRVAAVRGGLPRDIRPPVVERVDPDAAACSKASRSWRWRCSAWSAAGCAKRRTGCARRRRIQRPCGWRRRSCIRPAPARRT